MAHVSGYPERIHDQRSSAHVLHDLGGDAVPVLENMERGIPSHQENAHYHLSSIGT